MDLETILLSDDVSGAINDNLSYLITIIPELKAMIGFEHRHPKHHLDVWEHTMLALDLSEKDFDIRLTLLLHDIGKPHSYQDEEIRHFRGHAEKSVEMSKKILYRLGYEEDYINYICSLIKYHDTKITSEMIKNNYDFCTTLLKVQIADGFAHNPNSLEKKKQYFNKIEEKLSSRKRC